MTERMTRTARLDALIVRWLREYPDDFRKRVLGRLVHDTKTGCRTWSGGTNGLGYGRVHLPNAIGGDAHGYGASVGVHRAVWIHYRGEIPDDMLIDHDDPDVGCHNKLCAEVAHLVLSSHRGNTMNSPTSMGAVNARRTHCDRGHPLRGPDAILDSRGRCYPCRAERYETRNKARAALGMPHRAYAAMFGDSMAMAESILWCAELCRQAAQPKIR